MTRRMSEDIFFVHLLIAHRISLDPSTVIEGRKNIQRIHAGGRE